MNYFLYKKLRELFFIILNVLPNSFACNLNNLRQIIKKRNVYFNYDRNKKLFFAKDKKYKIYFNEKLRGINTYSYGINNRATSLARAYSLDKIKFFSNDLFIDCGANYGDLYVWTIINNLKIKYISFEPSPEEHACITLNCKNQINNNLALSNKNGYVNFFIKSDTGDSSIIEPASGYKKIIKVNTITLDKYVEKNNLKKIKLFKLEAEGFEPEILNGAEKTIKQIEYIAVDGGPERGKNKETTIEYVSEFLLKRNFSVIAKNKNNYFIKFLFKNSKI